ncbi:MAG: hypothetical protein HQK76_15665 [Desulfobacterales bacterium]|nr:hypothetical protein [Desulfobacterales bacterium]
MVKLDDNQESKNIDNSDVISNDVEQSLPIKNTDESPVSEETSHVDKPQDKNEKSSITIMPIGAAVHTRDFERGKDYSWHLNLKAKLFDTAEEVYRLILRDVYGETKRLALIVKNNIVGFMVCDIPCDRKDHIGRIIYDTLYLEFDKNQTFNIIKYIANILVCSDGEYKKFNDISLDYVENLYKNKELKEYTIFSFPERKISKKDEIIIKSALPTTSKNFNICANYLTETAHYKLNFIKSLVFASTGLKGLESCKMLADKFTNCVILTMSSEIQKETYLGKNPIVKKFKDIPIAGKFLKQFDNYCINDEFLSKWYK